MDDTETDCPLFRLRSARERILVRTRSDQSVWAMRNVRLARADVPSTSSQSLSTVFRNGTTTFVELPGLDHNVAETMDQCLAVLEASGLPTFPEPEHGSLWCNATFDTVMCWPATPANTSITQRCPPLKTLSASKNITKWCHESGRWLGRDASDFSRPHGWTNYTMCFTEEVIEMMTKLTNGSLGIAHEVAMNARRLEFVGLGLSLVSLLIAIAIFSCFRRLRVFRNLLHLQLMIAILMVTTIRLILYIDLIFTDSLGGTAHMHPDGKTINTTVFVCEAMFFLLEYFKTVAFCWMFLEGFCLHNQLVLTVFNSEPRLKPYLVAGYGIPLVHNFVWLGVMFYKKGGQLERCLGSYFLEPEFWILDGPRMLALVINLFFICNVIRVIWVKVRQSSNTGELGVVKKGVKAALMLITLLGIPNIMQTIPFSPTEDNLTFFAIWTYIASFFYMYQGFMIATIYCFVNKEVRSVLKTYYGRYKLQHASVHEMRRGSRAPSAHFQSKNGALNGSLNGNGVIPTYQGGSPRSKKGSDDSTANLVTEASQLPTDTAESLAGVQLVDYAGLSETTPLRAFGTNELVNSDGTPRRVYSNHGRNSSQSVTFRGANMVGLID